MKACRGLQKVHTFHNTSCQIPNLFIVGEITKNVYISLKTPCGINMSETVLTFRNFFFPNVKIDVSAIRKAI